MSLIDSEADKLAKMRSASGETKDQVAKPAPGLSRRFGSLNKASKKIEEFRNKNISNSTATVEQSRGTIGEKFESDSNLGQNSPPTSNKAINQNDDNINSNSIRIKHIQETSSDDSNNSNLNVLENAIFAKNNDQNNSNLIRIESTGDISKNNSIEETYNSVILVENNSNFNSNLMTDVILKSSKNDSNYLTPKFESDSNYEQQSSLYTNSQISTQEFELNSNSIRINHDNDNSDSIEDNNIIIETNSKVLKQNDFRDEFKVSSGPKNSSKQPRQSSNEITDSSDTKDKTLIAKDQYASKPKSLENVFKATNNQTYSNINEKSESESSSDEIRIKFESNSNNKHPEFESSSDEIRIKSTGNSDDNSNFNSNLVQKLNLNTKDVLFRTVNLGKTERKVLSYIRAQCSENLSLITRPLFREEMAKATRLNITTLKSSIQRLNRDNLIHIYKYKTGPGGWTIYQMSQLVFDHISDINSDDNSNFNSNQNASSKLVSNLNNNLLTKPADEFESLSFDFVHRFGITPSVIADIRKNKWNISREALEVHLERFSIWASDQSNVKGIQNLRGLFCANLKQIATTGTDPLDWVKTQADLALEQILLKRRASIEEKKKKLNELKDVEYENWRLQIDSDELILLVPGNSIAEFGSDMYEALVRNYFEVHVWPKIQKELSVLKGF